MSKPAFEVDKAGLAQLLERKGKARVILELLQNAFDEKGVTEVRVRLEREFGSQHVVVTVEDDAPEGFQNLAHAYTLFMSSNKKADPEQRGRFNLGEKLVIALCRRASILTTTGCISWDEEGRHTRYGKTSKGSVFVGEIRMTALELNEMAALLRTIIVPAGIELLLNGVSLPSQEADGYIRDSLPTEAADGEGVLRRLIRTTTVDFYIVRDGGEPTLYEMGIPVCPSGCPWHINVQQKIPLTLDREAVPDSFLVRVRGLALTAMSALLTPAQAREAWAAEVLPKTSPQGVRAVLEARYGEKRVIADPSDPEGTKMAVAAGYAVIQPGSFSKEEWTAIRDAGAALPAGQVTPSPKPFHPDGEPLKFIDKADWTLAQLYRAQGIQRLAHAVLGINSLPVRLVHDPDWGFTATFGGSGLILNTAALTSNWFELQLWDAEVSSLLIHEFAHHRCSDHLSKEFHEACCAIGADLVSIAITQPHLLK